MPLRRIFLAVPVPEEVIHLQNKLRETNSSLKKIKWTRNGNIHLTIYFIGNVPDEKFEKVVELVALAISGQEEFTLSFDSLFFAPPGRPRMLWAGYKKSDAFTRLSGTIHETLSQIPGKPGNKFFYKEPIPHITLARFHSMKNYRDIVAGNMAGFTGLPDIKIRSCELWETVKHEGRSDYRTVFSFSFNP